MAIWRRSDGARHFQALYALGPIGDLSDGQLLERFATRDGDRAELAFAALVERHGPMVLRTCRAVLRDGHDAHDAFQATFLVLARRAGSLWVRDSLGAWLHQVAHRTALCARSASARRRKHEAKAAELAPAFAPDVPREDLGEVLHGEIARLPDRFRAAVVLCLLEGLTNEQAAHHLGWPVGTLQSRLARGRERLRSRLTHRGLAPRVAPAGVVVPASLVDATARAATGLAAGQMTAGMVSASVLSLIQEVRSVMFFSKLKLVGAAVLCVGMGVSGVGVLAQQDEARPTPAAPADPHDPTPARPPVPPRPPMPPPAASASAPAPIRPPAPRPDDQLILPAPHGGERMTITIEGPTADGGTFKQQIIPEVGDDGRLHVAMEKAVTNKAGETSTQTSEKLSFTSIEIHTLAGSRPPAAEPVKARPREVLGLTRDGDAPRAGPRDGDAPRAGPRDGDAPRGVRMPTRELFTAAPRLGTPARNPNPPTNDPNRRSGVSPFEPESEPAQGGYGNNRGLMGSNTNPDHERRLTDMERKLDLILKKLDSNAIDNVYKR